LRHNNDVIQLTASRRLVEEDLSSGNLAPVAVELTKVKQSESLDVLDVTDVRGKVIIRAGPNEPTGDDQSVDPLVKAVLQSKAPVGGTEIVPAGDLRLESQALANQADIKFVSTPMARPRTDTEQTAGMMIKSAAPVFDAQGDLIGVVYGGVLLNRNYEIVDKVKQTVFQGMEYQGKDIGTSTIFQDDVRISTNVLNTDGSRAIGTRIQEQVYQQVVEKGQPWIAPAFVVNNWYIAAYEPIRNADQQIIGILYVGILQQRYVDLTRQTITSFLAIALAGALVTMLLAYLLARRISVPIRRLSLAASEVAGGNLDARVDVRSSDELGDLASAFNVMALALKERDASLKEFTRKKIMESERLALIGQLAANVAHDLNNPLQGIVTYSHLLLENAPCDGPATESLRKIVTQADRCRDIIRALLDFSRQRKPDKTLCSVNSILAECASLVERQASFQNIEMVRDLQQDLPLLILDPSQISRVFMNMIINAAEAMKDGGRLTLATRFLPDDQCVEVQFSDTGQGIAPENMDRIFDPFFTTKETGHGVGLGLAISHGIVAEHKGTISVVSQVGKGTTFVIRLPVAVEEVAIHGT
jgi:two-component system NtrC family sensor kinase